MMTEDKSLWVKSPYPDLIPVVGKTLPEFLWEKCHQWGDSLAYKCGMTGQAYTFAEIYRHSRGFAASLISHGDTLIQRGDTLALILPNMPEFTISLFGAWDAGLIVTLLNPSHTSEEMARQLNDSEAKLIVTTTQFLPAVLKARESTPKIQQIIIIGSSIPDDYLSFYEMTQTDPIGHKFLQGSEIDPLTTTLLLPYSSGTTGAPKGVMLTHGNLIANIEQYLFSDYADMDSPGNERTIAILPFFHIFGLFNVFHGLYEGNYVYCLPRFEPNKFISAFQEVKPTKIYLVPPLLQFLCQSPQFSPLEWASLKRILIGGAITGPAVIHKFQDKTQNQVLCQEAYGMTELSPTTHHLKNNKDKVGSIGLPLGSTVCKVIDIKAGKTLGPNERGELCIRGPQVMKGYFKNDKATAETIDPEGWLHTGDICYYDEDKHFYIVDRLKELIKVKGFQVAPSELEDLLREHGEVGDVAVIGVPDDESGELPRAYIVRKSCGLTAGQVNDFIKDRISTYKQLKGGIEFIDAIPKAPSGKILRRILLAEYKKKINDVNRTEQQA